MDAALPQSQYAPQLESTLIVPWFALVQAHANIVDVLQPESLYRWKDPEIVRSSLPLCKQDLGWEFFLFDATQTALLSGQVAALSRGQIINNREDQK